MKILRILIVLSCLGWIMASGLSAAGLVFNASDYPSVGTRNVIQVDTTGHVSVSLGAPGENQIWNFADTLKGDTISYAFVPPTDTPFYISGFADAGWAIQTKQWLSIPAISTLGVAATDSFFSLCYYEKMQNDTVVGIGLGTTTPFNEGGYPFSNPSTNAVFPMQIGTQWTKSYTTSAAAKVGAISGTIVAKDSSICVVDASGKLTIPLGDFDCLRVKSKRYISAVGQIPIGPIVLPVQISSDTLIVYDWYAKDVGLVLQVASHGREKNENFTDAGLVSRLASTNVVIDYVCNPECEVDPVPCAWMLEQNHPNPFNPETQIRYSLPRAARVQLKIYNLLGREIASLMDGSVPAGEHVAIWNSRDATGKSAPSGVYIYRLTAVSGDGQSVVQTKKMILAR